MRIRRNPGLSHCWIRIVTIREYHPSMNENEPTRFQKTPTSRSKPGESYPPIVPAAAKEPELTLRSIFWGVVLCVIFSVASAYSGLKVGQGMEAAIPISILAIGLARVYKRRTSLLENVIITGIGAASGSVVAGAIFTLPALYILHLDPHPVQTIFICLAGGCLGVLFLIPLRRYFVREMHGQLPFPEATAITEVLVTGEKGGSQAKLLLQATAIAGVYDFFVTTFHVWKEYLDFQFVPGDARARRQAPDGLQLRRHRLHPRPRLRDGPAQFHDPVRRRRALESCARAANLDDRQPHRQRRGISGRQIPIAQMTAAQIFRGYVRFVGVGAIATAGIFGILKSIRVVAGSFAIAARAFRRGPHHMAAGDDGFARTDRDIPVLAILIGVVVSAIGVAMLLGSLAASLPSSCWAWGSRCSSRFSSPPWPPMRLPPPPATPSPA